MPGWERTVVPPAAYLVDICRINNNKLEFPSTKSPSKPPILFEKDRKKHSQLSPNHHAVGVNARLLWAAAYSTRADYEEAKLPVLYYLDLELNQIGFMQSEQLTGVPHGGFYELAMYTGQLASLYKGDTELLQLQNEHQRRNFIYMNMTADKTGDVLCCGERMPEGPLASQQSAIYREAYNLPHLNNKQLSRQIDTDFWASLRAFRKVIAVDSILRRIINEVKNKADSGEITKLPFTSQRVQVDRWSTGHRAFYLDSGGDKTCQWVWVNNGNLRWGSNRHEVPKPANTVLQTFVTESRKSKVK